MYQTRCIYNTKLAKLHAVRSIYSTYLVPIQQGHFELYEQRVVAFSANTGRYRLLYVKAECPLKRFSQQSLNFNAIILPLAFE
jgi:hypothetical protein